MSFVVGFHGSFESFECAVYLFVNRNVDFGRCGPENNNAVNAFFFLEVADVLAELFNHLPACFAGHDVFAVKTFCIVVVESGLHRFDGFEFVLNGVDVFFFEHFAVDGALVCVCGINVPCTEHNVVEVGYRNDLIVFQIFFVCTFANTDFVVLGHGAYGFGKAFACHEHTGHEC